MNPNYGGQISPNQRKTAAERAREKLLAIYSSTVDSLKKLPSHKPEDSGYVAPPVPGAIYSNQPQYQQPAPGSEPQPQRPAQSETSSRDLNTYPLNYGANTAPSTPSQAYEPASPAESAPSYPYTATTSALKDAPINQTAVNSEWQKYHSAWQNYYQNYYSEYYAKAAQNYLATEKLKSERIASGKARRSRRTRHLLPVFLLAGFGLTLLFLQYNRMIFSPIMAYVSPDAEPIATSIEAVDPNVTQSVSPEPRLLIPKLNIDVPVAFNIPLTDVDSAMNEGVAQFKIPGASALPGQIGNLVISGHSAGDIYSSNPYKFIFSGLERLDVGDLIYINYESVRYTYQMTRREVVEPTDVSALIYDTDKPMLTLITCTPLGTSRYRLLITAEQISPGVDHDSATEEGQDSEAPSDLEMPANEPSFFENIWNGLFGN